MSATLLSGRGDSAELNRAYASYYATIAERMDTSSSMVTEYRLRSDVGEGSIEITQLQHGLRIVRYDVAYGKDHDVAFRFEDDRFELEACVDGHIRLSEDVAGRGTIRAASSSLTPPRVTSGMLTHPAGQRYRAVSITGCRQRLAPYLGSVGPDDFASALHALNASHSRDLYFGNSGKLGRVTRLLSEVYEIRPKSPSSVLMMESRVMAAFALLLAVGQEQAPDGLDAHEVDAVHTVAPLLWHHRHDLPTVDELARGVSISPKRLNAGFRAVYGTTLMQYHRRYCLERATELLATTDWTVERIGFEVGYSSASNFVYGFRTRLGCTPAEYRRIHRVG
ncbi:MAG: helix-turn-helix transcriptional regulator [Microbacterium sp.]|nr:helix-turn-helix transcriptional regulator [Microbacterium sp.]